MINPSIENALVLRRIPGRRPIAIQTLAEYVKADVEQGINAGALDAKLGAVDFYNHIHDLINDRTLVGGHVYWRNDAKPAYVSLSDSTAACLQLQPGIKALQEQLPFSPAGLLDLIVEEC